MCSPRCNGLLSVIRIYDVRAPTSNSKSTMASLPLTADQWSGDAQSLTQSGTPAPTPEAMGTKYEDRIWSGNTTSPESTPLRHNDTPNELLLPHALFPNRRWQLPLCAHLECIGSHAGPKMASIHALIKFHQFMMNEYTISTCRCRAGLRRKQR